MGCCRRLFRFGVPVKSQFLIWQSRFSRCTNDVTNSPDCPKRVFEIPVHIDAEGDNGLAQLRTAGICSRRRGLCGQGHEQGQ